jgi:hypothetical protein
MRPDAVGMPPLFYSTHRGVQPALYQVVESRLDLGQGLDPPTG